MALQIYRANPHLRNPGVNQKSLAPKVLRPLYPYPTPPQKRFLPFKALFSDSPRVRVSRGSPEYDFSALERMLYTTRQALS